MDHPEPLPKHPGKPIPECRKSFTLDEARRFIDQVMDAFHALEEMSDLRSMFETGKQLSRAYFDCHSFRVELADYLVGCDYPAFACRMMKRLNNMGVFKHDDIWFASFYFYNTTWNFSDICPDFATALASSGLLSLLNLNIAHKPYLDNLNSKNVYYLIKASLSIIHNIARVPGNMHYFASDSVKRALIQLARRDEADFLNCVSILCLAHIATDTDLHLLCTSSSSATNTTEDNSHHQPSVDLARLLVNLINSAQASEKRRCHGFGVGELLGALAAYSVHDAVKPTLLSTPLITSSPSSSSSSATTCLGLVKDMLESALTSSSTSSSSNARELEELVKILWNLTFDPNPSSSSALTGLKQWLGALLDNNNKLRAPAEIRLALDSALYKLMTTNQSQRPNLPAKLGPILVSYAPSNRASVKPLLDRLRQAQLPVNVEESTAVAVDHLDDESAAVGGALSACCVKSPSRSHWIDTLIGQSPLAIICLSDAYRLAPGCRLELEQLSSPESSSSYNRPLVPCLVQAKFKPSGWLTKYISQPPIDLIGGKRDFDLNLDRLVDQVKDLYASIKRQVDEAALANEPTPTSKPAVKQDGNVSRPSTAGDAIVVTNHITESRSSRSSLKRDDPLLLRQPSLLAPAGLSPKTTGHFLKTMSSTPSMVATSSGTVVPSHHAWRHVVCDEVRSWSTSTVATWLRFRNLGALTSQFAGGIDGVLLSQLAGLRVWAPEYFANSLRSELKLDFVDSLRLLEALDELAPEEFQLAGAEEIAAASAANTDFYAGIKLDDPNDDFNDLDAGRMDGSTTPRVS